jgi:hypothetical protein
MAEVEYLVCSQMEFKELKKCIGWAIATHRQHMVSEPVYTIPELK